jgi:hypothetical protein
MVTGDQRANSVQTELARWHGNAEADSTIQNPIFRITNRGRFRITSITRPHIAGA